MLLLDLMHIKHLLPKLEEYLRKPGTHVRQNKASKLRQDQNKKTSQNQTQRTNEEGNINKLEA